MLKQILSTLAVCLLVLSFTTASYATLPFAGQQGIPDTVQSDALDYAAADSSKIKTEGFWAAMQFVVPEKPSVFDDDYSTGLGGVVGFDHRLVSGLRFLIKVSYIGFPSQAHDSRQSTIGLFTVGMDLRWFPVRSSVKLRPYVVGGVGVALLWQSPGGDEISTPDGPLLERWRLQGRESFCYNLGVGVERRLSGTVSIFAQLGSTVISTIEDNSAEDNLMRLTSLSLGLQIATK